MSQNESTPDHGASATRLVERRAFVRLASDLAATCVPTGRLLEAGWPGTVIDISPGGIGLLLRHRFRPDTNLTVELRNGAGKLLRTAEVHVTHATAVLAEGNPLWLLGCAFLQPLSDEEFLALR